MTSRFTEAAKDRPITVSMEVAKEDVIIPHEITVATTRLEKEDGEVTLVVLKVEEKGGAAKMVLLHPDHVDEVIAGLMEARAVALSE